MQKKILIIMAILALLAVSMCVMAQGGNGGGEGKQRPGRPGNPSNRPPGMRAVPAAPTADMIFGSLDQMKTDLNLSDDQTSQISKLREKYMDLNKKLMEEARKKQPLMSPDSRPEPGSPEEKAMQAAMQENMRKVQEEQMNIRNGYEEELKGILTKEQLEKRDTIAVKNILLGNIRMSEKDINERLNLSDAQKTDFNNLLTKATKDLYESQLKQIEKIKETRAAYDKDVAVNKDKIDAEISKGPQADIMKYLSDDTKKLMEEAKAANETSMKIINTFVEDFKKLLNPEQTETYNKLLSQSRQKGFEGMKRPEKSNAPADQNKPAKPRISSEPIKDGEAGEVDSMEAVVPDP